MGRRERPGVYKAFSQPTYARVYTRPNITNHAVKSRAGVTKRENLLGTKIQCRSRRTFGPKQERGRGRECDVA